MFKMILEDYRGRFFASLKAVSSAGTFYFCLGYFYIGYFYMGFMTGADAVRYAMGVVPMLAGLLLSRMYPNEIHKILFLCPMSENDRKKYMITAYAVRIGISMMLYALFSLALLAAGVVSVLEMLEIGVLVLAFLMGANMHHALFSMQTARAEGDEYYWLSLGYGLLFMVSWVISGCAMASFSVRDGIFVQAGVLTERHLDMSAAVMILLEVVFNAAICLICYKPVMEFGMNYEKNM